MAPRNWGFNLKSNSTNYPDHGHHGDPPPTKKNSHGRAGNRTRDLLVSSQKLWPPDHEAGRIWIWKEKFCYKINVNHENQWSGLPVVGTSECILTSSQQSSVPEANLNTIPYTCEEMKSPTSSQRTVLFRNLWDQSLSWGVSRQNVWRMIKRWLDKQHLVMWRRPAAHKGRLENWSPDLIWLQRHDYVLSLNRTQSRVVIGLLTGLNISRRHLHLMGLSNNPICNKCGTEEKTSVDVLCACESLASLIHSYTHTLIPRLLLFGPRDIRKLNIGGIWKFAEGRGLL